MSKLSVIVPIYNGEDCLEKCLDSLISQTYSDIQIILVDDGSSDNSGTICDLYSQKDKRISVLHQKNQGPLVARYNGVKYSHTEYVTFVDADDWLDIDAYSKFEDILNTEVDLIIYGKIVETMNSGSTYPEFMYKQGYYDKEEICKKIYGNMIWDIEKKIPGISQSLNDKIFKRKYLLKSYEEARDFPRLHYGEDPMILYPLMQWVESLYISKECPYHYRKHIKSVPSYLSNDDFFEKIYLWYKYLSEHTKQINNVTKQIEYIYIYLLDLRREYYGDFVHNDEYLFPFNKVEVNSRIILYGAGRQGVTYHEQIGRINYCNVIAWIDKNYNLYQEWGVKDIECIKEINDYDYIVLAIYSTDLKNKIRKWLLSIGVKREKIV